MSGLPIDYTQARLHARYGLRSSEALWNQVRSARSLAALLETLRASPLRRWVDAIPFDADADEVELRLRTELRAAVDEVAGWMPGAWQPAVRWCRHLVDLPAIARLATGEPPLPWMTRDAVLQAYAESEPDARRAALRAGPLARIVAGIEDEAARAAGGPPGAGEAIARVAWLERWREVWPRDADDEAEAIEALVRIVEHHLEQFVAQQHPDEAWAARRALTARLEARFRRYAFSPAAAFAYLALVALDLERLRAHLVRRAAFGQVL